MAKARKKLITFDSKNILGTTLSDEDRGLLHENYSSDEESSSAHPRQETEGITSRLNQGSSQGSQYPRTKTIVRSPNRVRFDLSPSEDEASRFSPPPPPPPPYADSSLLNSRNTSALRTPLLTNVETPLRIFGNEEEEDEEDILAWAERDNRRPRSGLGSAFMNMANSIIGAGIIGQPYAFRQSGLFAGITLLLILTIMVDWTINLIIINSKLSGSNSFQGTMEHCFGRKGLIIISLVQWAFAFGGMVAYGVIVGDTIPHVIFALWPGVENIAGLKLLINRRFIILILMSGISYPLSLYRDIAKLAKASTLAILSMVIILITVISQGPSVPRELRDRLEDSFLTVKSGFFQAVSVISFALVCHHNSHLIYDSLKTPTIDRFAKVTHYSTMVSMLACLLMALSGFLTFGSLTQGNVLNNFPPGNVLVSIARLCFGLNMLITFPLEAFVCREVIVNYWFSGDTLSNHFHFILTTSLVSSAVFLSLVTCDLGIVLELIGAVSACALAYIFPPLCYLKLSTRSWKSIPAILCIIFGVLAMVISLIQTLVKTLNHETRAVACQ